MKDSRIVVRDLHKDYVLREAGAGSLKNYVLWWRRKAVRTREVKQVLKGISFEVKAGECFALLGRNGAGKSTLLSILARVVRPTSGSVEVHGRVAPLLQLGAGFHPDLSGRDNVEFNAMLMGLSRREIRTKMDSIISFAELEEYIDMPVRTYSSGMSARLGFSVAVHVDAETLIVDEALSVGDFVFVRKCVERIKEYKANGGTILFVSHGFDSVRGIADRCIWLDHGVIAAEGDPEEVIRQYEIASPHLNEP